MTAFHLTAAVPLRDHSVSGERLGLGGFPTVCFYEARPRKQTFQRTLSAAATRPNSVVQKSLDSSWKQSFVQSAAARSPFGWLALPF